MTFIVAAVSGFLTIIAELAFAFALPGYLMRAPVGSWGLEHFDLIGMATIMALSASVAGYMAMLAALEK